MVVRRLPWLACPLVELSTAHHHYITRMQYNNFDIILKLWLQIGTAGIKNDFNLTQTETYLTEQIEIDLIIAQQ